jgi:hypothetical protein
MRYYRAPRTTAERRANEALAADECEYGILPRAARTGHNLPSAWDDIRRSDLDNRRSWKRYRRTRWKPIEA